MTVRWPAVVGIGLGYGCLLTAVILGWQQLMAGQAAVASWPWFAFVPLLVLLAVATVERGSSRMVPVRSLCSGAITALLGAVGIGLATLLAGEVGSFALGAGLAHGALGAMEAVVAVGIFLAPRSKGMPAGEAREMAELPDETRRAA